jgi:diaminohydroxyphosphoribosylaminopyrimidine deaminase/5-amino-6-(5-phosphoribosylamino)uracil reductase
VDAHDIRFMQHALDLARKATGLASPNPLVGCVIVQNGEFIGQGFHEYDGRAHAEVLALRATGEKARGATLYVTLEPCSHTGRTGPCSDAIIAAGVTKVVAAMQDPNPAVAGRGFEKLRAAGVEVQTGLLEDEARKVNEAFACWITTRRPFVTLKSALTLDGQLALPADSAKGRGSAHGHAASRESPVGSGATSGAAGKSSVTWITSEESRAEVHRMRHASDALLTGIGTILADNPLLTDRSGLPRRRRLLRVILDSKLRLAEDSRIVRTVDEDLLIFTRTPLTAPRARKLVEAGAELVQVRKPEGSVELGSDPGIDLEEVLTELGRREVLSVLLEAGPRLNGAALAAGVVHKLALFYAPKIAGGGTVPFASAAGVTRHGALHNTSVRMIGPDFLVEGYCKNVYGNY